MTPPATSAGHISSCWWQLHPRSPCPAADLRGAKRYLTVCQTTTFCISQVLHSNNTGNPHRSSGLFTPTWLKWSWSIKLCTVSLVVWPCSMGCFSSSRPRQRSNGARRKLTGSFTTSVGTEMPQQKRLYTQTDRNIIEIHRASGDIWYKNVPNQQIRPTPGTTWPLK